MRLPYVRAAAPDVLATARAQRWDPAEVLRVLWDQAATVAAHLAHQETGLAWHRTAVTATRRAVALHPPAHPISVTNP